MAFANKRNILIAASTVAAMAAACGSNNSDLFPVQKGDGGSSDDGPVGKFSTGEAAAYSPDSFAGCAAITEQAKELPLDLYLMLDTSGSMDDLVAAQKSKWSAVQSALTDFVNDPASAGIGIGLQYFPLTQAGLPASCTASTQCGAADSCLVKACNVNSTSVYICDSNADCPGVACVAVGE
jgi:hypothetical protein